MPFPISGGRAFNGCHSLHGFHGHVFSIESDIIVIVEVEGFCPKLNYAQVVTDGWAAVKSQRPNKQRDIAYKVRQVLRRPPGKHALTMGVRTGEELTVFQRCIR